MINFLRKIELGLNGIVGLFYKFAIDFHLLAIPELQRGGNELIVSLTSYGRRVSTGVVYYTIVSLLRQNKQPDIIIMWLAEDEWNDNSLPQKLLCLKDKGVEICYCKDIKSYKKLIPSLKKYPNSTIITVDDDMIYSKDTIELLYQAHQNYPRDIVCTVARQPKIKDRNLDKYSLWADSLVHPFIDNTSGKLLFPVGVGGVLYPSGTLHEDVINENLFMNFCPLADDIWFWFCGLRKNAIKRYVVKKSRDLSFDSLYQYFHKGSALTHTNNIGLQNDVQIKRLFEYYNYSF